MPKPIQTAHSKLLVPAELIKRHIYMIRGQKVMLDSDLARLYQVLTKNLNLAVRRNGERFPEDFMFQLTSEEAESLRLQFATSNTTRGGRRYSPYGFTEHGVVMLSSVLKSRRAVQMNILIMRAFVKMRELLASHRQLAARVERLETNQKRHSSVINILADEIDQMRKIPETPKRRIGFKTDGSSESLTMAHVSR